MAVKKTSFTVELYCLRYRVKQGVSHESISLLSPTVYNLPIAGWIINRQNDILEPITFVLGDRITKVTNNIYNLFNDIHGVT